VLAVGGGPQVKRGRIDFWKGRDGAGSRLRCRDGGFRAGLMMDVSRVHMYWTYEVHKAFQ
jgi:hypothetical protein